MTQFTAGQKLTAKDLNEAFDSVAGPINPSKDYQWTQTNVGKIQKAWDTFIQVQNQNPETLEIGIGYSEVGSETVAEIDGKKPAALRRVFINVGPKRGIQVGEVIYRNIPVIGSSNDYPLIGIVGIEYHRPSGVYMPGDGKFHFSLFNPQLYPASGSTPAQWGQNQQLWEDDEVRGCDTRNWWWTGITLERHEPPDAVTQASVAGNDIICFPMYLLYTPVPAGSGEPIETSNRVLESRAILCVMLEQDFYRFRESDIKEKQKLVNYLNAIYDIPGLDLRIAFSNNLGMKASLGKYVVSDTKTQNAYYHTLKNYVTFNQDTGPWKLVGYIPSDDEWLSWMSQRNPYILGTTWIDENGKQRGFQNNLTMLEITDENGEPVEDQGILDYYLACGYNPNKMEEPVLSCVLNNALTDLPEDGVDGLLSGLFNDEDYGLSSDMQKRLIWICRNDTHGVQYYDTCPDFRTGETPDSDISASCLSSIQEKEIELEVEEGQEAQSKKLWSLWGFDDFENVKGWPEPAEISGWDLVTRHIHEVEGKNVGEIQYISLSALSGGGAPGDADLPIAGLSSIQTRTLTGGEKVLQLYKFDDGEYVEDDIGNNLSSYDMVLRNREDNCVAYGSLSAIGGEVDLSGTDGTHKKGSAFKFQSASDSNIIVSIDNNGVITIGAYYL